MLSPRFILKSGFYTHKQPFVAVGYGRDTWKEGLQDIIYICDQFSVRMDGRCEQEKNTHKHLTLVAKKQLRIVIFRGKIVLSFCYFFMNAAVHS